MSSTMSVAVSRLLLLLQNAGSLYTTSGVELRTTTTTLRDRLRTPSSAAGP